MFRMSCVLMHMLAFLEFPRAHANNGRRHSRRLRGLQESNGDGPGKRRRSAYYDPGQHNKRQEFELVCRSELRSKSADGMLSQVEFAGFLFDYCDNDPQKGPACEEGLLFRSLAPQIQYNFVAGLCPANMIERVECLQFLDNQGGEFGYIEELDELCVSTFALLDSSGLLDLGGSTSTNVSTGTDTDFAVLIDPLETLRTEEDKTKKLKKQMGMGMGMGMSRKNTNDRKEVMGEMAVEVTAGEPSSVPSGKQLRSPSPPGPLGISATTSETSPSDPLDISATTSKTSPPDPLDISATTSSTSSESAGASDEGISIVSRLGMSAAGFVVVILAVCSASKRRRTESGVVFIDHALDGGESIFSEDSGALEFAVQKGVTPNGLGGDGCSRSPSSTWFHPTKFMDRFKDTSRQEPQPTSFPGGFSEREMRNILWGSAASPKGFFRRQSACLRLHDFLNRSNGGDRTPEDDSTIETKEYAEVDNSSMRPGGNVETDLIASGVTDRVGNEVGVTDRVGNEVEDIVQPVTRRAWRAKASRPFFSILGVRSGETNTQEAPVDSYEEKKDSQEQFHEKEPPVQSMSRSDWKRTLLESYDDETSLGSFAEVSAEVRKQFKEFDTSLTKGFVDLRTRAGDSRRASCSLDDDDSSVSSLNSLHLDTLARELASCDGENIDLVARPRETDGSVHASLTKGSSPTASLLTPRRQRRDHQLSAVLVEDKPWRDTEGLRSTRSTSARKTANLAEKFENPRRSSQRDDGTLVDSEDSQISAGNAQNDDDIVRVSALRDMFQRPSTALKTRGENTENTHAASGGGPRRHIV